MSSARENILQKIRAVRGDSQSNALPELIRPAINSDHVAQFREKLELGGGKLNQVKDYSAAASLITDFLIEKELPMRLRLAPALKQMQWGDQIDISYGKSDGDDLVSVTPAFCAIAETGTLMLLSGPQTPASVSLLPETHIAVVPVSRIVATMEDAFALLRAEHGGLPRAVNFISGPSRTGDIEQTIVLGAHGPCRVHLILVESL